ncbi:hypothetical protein SAMN05421790_10529 [Kroppenstedtia eburnea]|uniref:Uncharacterized protein n=1 Tax=Kroppenstedtia eburnea TaxID=714067 RepID=A0A1N7LWB3_9BACL|nr:hypothetical protein SAMN05421790_10529 [Kroppenstedtia eburnea]
MEWYKNKTRADPQMIGMNHFRVRSENESSGPEFSLSSLFLINSSLLMHHIT